MKQILIDRFVVPEAALQEFNYRMQINRNLIKTLPGFVEDRVYRNVEPNLLNYVTMTVWESDEVIEDAKKVVQAAYQHQGFDMPAMLKRLDIKIDRKIYEQVYEEGGDI